MPTNPCVLGTKAAKANMYSGLEQLAGSSVCLTGVEALNNLVFILGTNKENGGQFIKDKYLVPRLDWLVTQDCCRVATLRQMHNAAKHESGFIRVF